VVNVTQWLSNPFTDPLLDKRRTPIIFMEKQDEILQNKGGTEEEVVVSKKTG
jgi:hypothetical protein